MGSVWRDWVLVDWDDDGILPNKIWGFIDLRQLPENTNIEYGGLVDLAPAYYAIVKSATYSTNERQVEMLEIFVPIQKEVGRMRHGYVSKLKFYLADVEAFVDPIVVIPDIGGRATDYFLLKNRTQWQELFVEWLESPPEEDIMSNDEEDDDDNTNKNYNKHAGSEEEEDSE